MIWYIEIMYICIVKIPTGLFKAIQSICVETIDLVRVTRFSMHTHLPEIKFFGYHYLNIYPPCTTNWKYRRVRSLMISDITPCKRLHFQ